MEALLLSSDATVCAERCDTGEGTHIGRLVLALPSVAGVWHAAGVLADALLFKQAAFALARVCAPKMQGAWGLHKACATAAVGMLALFSSVAALLGGAGQANYSAANACLDALASCRRGCA